MSYFDDVERELVRAARVQNRVRRLRRGTAVAFAAALLLGAGGTAAAATYLALRSSSIAPFAADATTPEQRVAPGTSRVLDLRAPDPAGDVPPWALRVSSSASGLTCTTVGQVSGSAFGIVGLDHRFRELPDANADACAEDPLGTRVFYAPKFKDVRTVVYGLGGKDLQRVTLSVAGGAPKTLRHSADGGFLAVLRGYPEDTQPVVTIRRDGRTRRYPFADGGFVVADPLGGRAWKLTAFAIGTPRGEPRPARQVGCMSFSSARAVPGEPNAGSPPVCGLEAPTTLYFTTRRLAGDSTNGNFLAGDWNHHAPRTAVWGTARSHRHIIVRAPGIAREVEPRINAGFLVILPSSVDPASVTVEVDGKRYGNAYGVVPPPKGAR